MVNNIAYMDPMGVETKILRCFCWNPDPELRSSNLRQSEGTVQATSWEKEQNTIYYSLLFYHLVIKPDVLKKPQFSSVIFPTTNLHLARGLYIEFQPPPAPPPLSLRPRPGTQIYPNHVSSGGSFKDRKPSRTVGELKDCGNYKKSHPLLHNPLQSPTFQRPSSHPQRKPRVPEHGQGQTVASTKFGHQSIVDSLR